MSQASRDAYASILPELPAREAAVLQTLLTFREAPGCGPGSVRRGPTGMTNREIARILGLDRDSISPRTARLRQKGLLVEAGVRGKETLYEAALEPQFDPKPRSKPKAWHDAIVEAASAIAELRQVYLPGTCDFETLKRAEARVRELS